MSEEQLFGQAMRFIAKYVSKLYGSRFIENWMKKNKGSRFIDMITMSDIAYCISLVDNYHEAWEEEIKVKKEIAKLSEGEQVEFKRRKLTKADKVRFLGGNQRRESMHLKREVVGFI